VGGSRRTQKTHADTGRRTCKRHTGPDHPDRDPSCCEAPPPCSPITIGKTNRGPRGATYSQWTVYLRYLCQWLQNSNTDGNTWESLRPSTLATPLPLHAKSTPTYLPVFWQHDWLYGYVKQMSLTAHGNQGNPFEFFYYLTCVSNLIIVYDTSMIWYLHFMSDEYNNW